jgi:glucose dehydrogenase
MIKRNALVMIAISAVGLLTAILITGLSILAFAQKQQEQQPQQQNTNTNNSANPSSTIIVIPQGASVTKSGQYYNPENAQIPVNSKVTWTNKDSLPHTATASGSNSFDTNIIQAGSSSSITFSSSKYTAGTTIHYICTIHPWMAASLTLSPISGGVPPQSQSVPSSISSGGGGTQEQQVIPVHSTVVKVLPKSSTTTLGTEPEHKNDWVTAERDIFGTKNSNQTTIGKNNVNKLQVKWIIHSDFTIENPPLIIGDRGYLQDNAMRVMAFDVNTGLNIWKYDPGSSKQQLASRGVSFSHGLTYDNGVIFAGTGGNATVVALNATDGKLIWQSIPVGDPKIGYGTVAAPTVWKDIVIEGQALGDNPPFPAVLGKLTAFNRTNGEKLWNLTTAIGSWVEGKNATINGGANPWSGGSLDPKTGVYYTSTGNPAPDFNDTSRPGPNLWSGSILAVDSKTGHMLWGTQISKPNTKDYDSGFGISLASIPSSSSDKTTTAAERVIVHGTKRGDAYALDATNGHILWKLPVGIQYNTDAKVTPNGTGPVWPGSQGGVEYATANDNKTAYFAVSNMGPIKFFPTHEEPIFSAKGNGLGNGTVTAVDIKTGKIKWVYPTEFPLWTSPTITNGLVFAGHMTATGKPYQFGEFGAPTVTPLNPSGIIFALDKDTGKKLWEFNVGSPIGVGGPSVGHGMLLVTTGAPASAGLANKGGDVIAFGLPSAENQTLSTSNTTK